MDNAAIKLAEAGDTARRAADGFDWADPLDLEGELSEEERMVRDTARDYAQEKLFPRVIAAYRDEKYDPALRDAVDEEARDAEHEACDQRAAFAETLHHRANHLQQQKSHNDRKKPRYAIRQPQPRPRQQRPAKDLQAFYLSVGPQAALPARR